MAWRPSEYVVEGLLDNTVAGKVTGWIRFAGMKQMVRLDLDGDFHRDIRGTKIHLLGTGCDEQEAARYMEGFSPIQTGTAGDITAGLMPQDYVDYPYIEWYSQQNGRVVLELEPEQIEVIGTPLPPDQCKPISRAQQTHNLIEFLASVARTLRAPTASVDQSIPITSDPAFTHWVVEDGVIVGEARCIGPVCEGRCFAFVRLFAAPDQGEYGYIESARLRVKDGS